jgi:hypothetical protein
MRSSKKLGEDDCRVCGARLKGKRINKRRLCIKHSREKWRKDNLKHYHEHHPHAKYYKNGI